MEESLSKRLNKQRVIALTELLIGVILIGILAAIAIPNYSNARLKAKIADAHSEIMALAIAQELYALDNGGSYPPESESYPYDRGRWEAGLFFLTSPVPYIAAIPNDPFVRPEEKTGHKTPRAYETGVCQRGRKFVAYVIFSIGPDGSENGIVSAQPFQGSQHNGGQGNTYASSNGLTSSGDIYRYDGNCWVARNLIIDGNVYNGICPPNLRN